MASTSFPLSSLNETSSRILQPLAPPSPPIGPEPLLAGEAVVVSGGGQRLASVAAPVGRPVTVNEGLYTNSLFTQFSVHSTKYLWQ